MCPTHRNQDSECSNNKGVICAGKAPAGTAPVAQNFENTQTSMFATYKFVYLQHINLYLEQTMYIFAR